MGDKKQITDYISNQQAHECLHEIVTLMRTLQDQGYRNPQITVALVQAVALLVGQFDSPEREEVAGECITLFQRAITAVHQGMVS